MGAGPAAIRDDVASSLLAAKEAQPAWADEFYTWLIAADKDLYDSKVKVYQDRIFGALVEQKITGTRGVSPSNPFTVMELGIGAGPNLHRYAADDVTVIGVDPSRASQSYAEASATRAGLKPEQFRFVRAVAEGLPLESDSVDAVVTTLVLCSVADVQRSLSEVARVLKPGGKYYFLEHVAAPAGTSLRFWQSVLDPAQQFLFDGCHLTREPLPAIQSAGFAAVDAEQVMIDGLSLISSHLVGQATKASGS